MEKGFNTVLFKFIRVMKFVHVKYAYTYSGPLILVIKEIAPWRLLRGNKRPVAVCLRTVTELDKVSSPGEALKYSQ